MARWLVDGMNVIGSRPDGWWRDRQAAQRRLVEGLERLARERGDEVTVVFDGSAHEMPEGSVEVLFASRRGRDAADDDIAALVERDRSPEGLTVVTSDGELAGRVGARGGMVTGAGAFRRVLDQVAG